MRQIRTVVIDERTVTVRELTVSEVRLWFKSLEQVNEGGVDVVGECLIADISLGDVCRMTDLQPADIDALAPSEIDQVITVCLEINPHFFQMRGNLLNLGKTIQQAPADTWKEQPAA